MADKIIPAERHELVWRLHAQAMALVSVLKRELDRDDEESMVFAVPHLFASIERLNDAVFNTVGGDSCMPIEELRALACVEQPAEVAHGN